MLSIREVRCSSNHHCFFSQVEHIGTQGCNHIAVSSANSLLKKSALAAVGAHRNTHSRRLKTTALCVKGRHETLRTCSVKWVHPQPSLDPSRLQEVFVRKLKWHLFFHPSRLCDSVVVQPQWAGERPQRRAGKRWTPCLSGCCSAVFSCSNIDVAPSGCMRSISKRFCVPALGLSIFNSCLFL